jgi:hypothetical protein
MGSQRLVGRPGSWSLVMALFCVGSFAWPASRAQAENRCSASYSWVADFDLRLPDESSTAGMNGCDARD